MSLFRYFHTLRHLRPVQITGRLWHRLNPAKPDLSATPSLQHPTGQWTSPAEHPTSMLAADTFTFLNVVGQVRNEADWNDPAREKLWLYNLHYFDDLNAVGAADRAFWHRSLVARWVEENLPGAGNGWEPYPTSLRIVNWIKWSLAGNVLDPAWMDSLAVQARWLRRHIEWHLLGNHLFVNAKALVFAGLFFQGDEADEWLAQGLKILGREVPEQVLPDGGHFELSPMYHAIILEDVLDLVNAAGAWPGRAPEAVVSQWREVAARMLLWLEQMIHPDGEIAFFNDASLGIAPGFMALAAYAGRLGVGVAGNGSKEKDETELSNTEKSPQPSLGKALFALAGDLRESRWEGGLPLSQRGTEGDFSKGCASSSVRKSPLTPLCKRGEPCRSASPVNEKSAFEKGDGQLQDAGSFTVTNHGHLSDPKAASSAVSPFAIEGSGARCTHLVDSGYVRMEQANVVALLDVARIGPDYLPGHAHADTLSFELSLFGQRVVVNSGTSQYGLGAERLRQRGTAAHSTVEVDGADSSEVWGGFRVARRARPFGLVIQSGLAASQNEASGASPSLSKALFSLPGDAFGAGVPPFIKGGAGEISEAPAQVNVATPPPAPLLQREGRGATHLPASASPEKVDQGLSVTCAHDGYKRLPGKPVHRRWWRLGEYAFKVSDFIDGEFHSAVARYYLHPSVRVTGQDQAGQLILADGQVVNWSVAGGVARVVPATWHPEFGVVLPSQCVEIQFDGAEAAINFSWE